MFGDSLPRGVSQWPEGIFFMLTKEELSALSDEDLSLLLSSLKSEKAAREKRKSCVQKGDAAKSMKRDMRCPHCLCRLRKDGRRKDGAQRYECPVCGRHSCDTTCTSLSSSKLTIATISKVVSLIFLDCPDWVISWILGIDQNRAVLKEPMSRRYYKMVDGIDAFQSRLD